MYYNIQKNNLSSAETTFFSTTTDLEAIKLHENWFSFNAYCDVEYLWFHTQDELRKSFVKLSFLYCTNENRYWWMCWVHTTVANYTLVLYSTSYYFQYYKQWIRCSVANDWEKLILHFCPLSLYCVCPAILHSMY